jgi:hypothetical protein
LTIQPEQFLIKKFSAKHTKQRDYFCVKMIKTSTALKIKRLIKSINNRQAKTGLHSTADPGNLYSNLTSKTRIMNSVTVLHHHSD